jgi:hypothetical protein
MRHCVFTFAFLFNISGCVQSTVNVENTERLALIYRNKNPRLFSDQLFLHKLKAMGDVTKECISRWFHKLRCNFVYKT